MKYVLEYTPPYIIRDIKLNSPQAIPEDYYRELFPHHELEERAVAVYLNAMNQPITHEIVGIGTLTASMVNIQKVCRTAVLTGTHGVILIHNHPSNNTRESVADRKITESLHKALQLFDCKLLDSLIYTRDEVVSLRERGLL